MRRALTLAMITLLALAGCGGYQVSIGTTAPPSDTAPLPAGSGTGDPGDSAGPPEPGAGGGDSGGGDSGGGDTGGNGPVEPTGPPGEQPTDEPTGPPPGEAVELERLLLLPVALVAPPGCFTEGLSKRYVDGYGAQVVDPRPHGDIVATRVEYEQLTRLQMDSTQRRVNLLPGSGRPVEVLADDWIVQIDIHMFLSGGFKIDYSRTHRGTGSFRQTFTSPVDPTCAVEIVYGLTTSPLS
jgi:hypothetical protein